MFEKIQLEAYLKWERAGSPQGNDGVHYWLEAERELSEGVEPTCDDERPQPRKVAAKASAKRK